MTNIIEGKLLGKRGRGRTKKAYLDIKHSIQTGEESSFGYEGSGCDYKAFPVEFDDYTYIIHSYLFRREVLMTAWTHPVPSVGVLSLACESLSLPLSPASSPPNGIPPVTHTITYLIIYIYNSIISVILLYIFGGK